VQVGRHGMAGIRIHKGQNTKYSDIVHIYVPTVYDCLFMLCFHAFPMENCSFYVDTQVAVL